MNEVNPDTPLTPCLANLPEAIRRKCISEPSSTTARWSRGDRMLLAEASRTMGVNYSTLWRVVNQIGKPATETLAKVCGWVGWRLDAVMGLDRKETE